MTRKLSFIFIISLFASANLAAQVSSALQDSLKDELSHAKNDSIRFRILIRLSINLTYQDNKQAQGYSNEAMDIANKHDWPWAKAIAYFDRGSLSDFYGDYTTSLESYNKALQTYLTGSDSASICTAYLNVGNAYIELGKLEEAYFHSKKAFEWSQKLKDTLSMAISVHNLAVIYSNLHQLDIAVQHFRVSADYSKIANDVEGPVYNHHELGRAYLLAGKFDKALEHLAMAVYQSKKLPVTILIPKTYQSMAELLLKTKKYKECLLYYDSAIQVFKSTDNHFGQAECNLGKSRVLAAQGKFKEANEIAQHSLKKANDLKAQVLEFDCHLALAEIAESQGDFKAALLHNKHAQQARDSLTSVNVMSDIFESEFEMRSQKKDAEIANLSKQKEKSATELKRQEFLRNIFAVVFALTIVLLYSVYRSGRRKVEMNDLLIQHQAEIEKRTQELEELNKVKDKFFSIISHDLRSPINSLSGLLDLMEKNEIKAEELPLLTVEMRKQFNHTKTLINNLLDWTLLQMNKVSIKKEKILLKGLIDGNIKLLSSMSSKKTTFNNEVNETLTAFADQNMINLVFRNLILNGIKFTESTGTIKISAVQEENFIKVSIADNGVGIAPDIQKVLFDKTTGYSTRGTANEKGTGLGLILCKEFVERNGGKIWLESEVGKGSTFFVTIPTA